MGYDKSLLDTHQRVVVSSDNTGSGTATWISNNGHLVTVWTPSLVSQPLTSARENTRCMNRINARRNIRGNSSDEASKDHRNVAETKTWLLRMNSSSSCPVIEIQLPTMVATLAAARARKFRDCHPKRLYSVQRRIWIWVYSFRVSLSTSAQ